MKTNFNVITKVKDKSLHYSVLATMGVLTLTSNSAFAAFDETVGSDRNQSNSMVGNNGSAEQGLTNIYQFIKWIAVIIGLVFAISGLMAVSKAAKTDGQKSQMPGWITFGIGGLLTVVGIFMFAVGKTATSVIGAGGETTTN